MVATPILQFMRRFYRHDRISTVRERRRIAPRSGTNIQHPGWWCRKVCKSFGMDVLETGAAVAGGMRGCVLIVKFHRCRTRTHDVEAALAAHPVAAWTAGAALVERVKYRGGSRPATSAPAAAQNNRVWNRYWMSLARPGDVVPWNVRMLVSKPSIRLRSRQSPKIITILAKVANQSTPRCAICSKSRLATEYQVLHSASSR